MSKDFNYVETVNIFTDSSTKFAKLKDRKISINIPGFVATIKSRLVYNWAEIYLDETVPYSEIKAIEMAIHWIRSLDYRLNFEFNIFSDSECSVKAINNILANYYINNNMKMICGKYNVLKVIASYIAYNILAHNKPINIFYVPAHVNLSTFESKKNKLKTKIIEANNDFYRRKYLDNIINNKTIYELATFNNVIDMLTRNIGEQYMDSIQKDINYNSEQFYLERKGPISWPFINNENKLPLYKDQYPILPANNK